MRKVDVRPLSFDLEVTRELPGSHLKDTWKNPFRLAESQGSWKISRSIFKECPVRKLKDVDVSLNLCRLQSFVLYKPLGCKLILEWCHPLTA